MLSGQTITKKNLKLNTDFQNKILTQSTTYKETPQCRQCCIYHNRFWRSWRHNEAAKLQTTQSGYTEKPKTMNSRQIWRNSSLNGMSH